jgi:hypothetical protein
MTALASLYGAKEREQTVFSPQNILDVPQTLWGRIQYDACHGAPGVAINRRKGKPDMLVAVESLVNAVTRTDRFGLILPWPPRTYVNPPYGPLHAWLVMSMMQASEHIMLIPLRPHRVWWRKWRRMTEVVALNPVKFVGHLGTFPAPLVLGHRNPPNPGQMTALCEKLGLGEAL